MNQNQEPGDGDRIDAEIEEVAERREGYVGAKQERVTVIEEVSSNEEKLGRGEQVPRDPGLRAMEPGSDQDHQRRRQADEV